MHLHVLGIGGTFMSALALLARASGYKVTGSDANCYPPISDLLAKEGIEWTEGYEDTSSALEADCVVVGNAIKRGMPVIEAVLDAGKPYFSGPDWLAQHILSNYRVLSVSGTHGKTTTTSMLAHILEQAGLAPGFLIGGVASNFGTNARLGQGEWFVIEADEYDSAFFDKRPKFMHYHPECAVLNNLEFDHADIYPDLQAIQKQVHYFLKTIPPSGELLYTAEDTAIQEVLAKGVFSHASGMNVGASADATWRAVLLDEVGRAFEIFHHDEKVAQVRWSLIGEMNVQNALSAFAASIYAGVEPAVAASALEQFKQTKRRLEVRFSNEKVKLYDDFAHHPTAIEKTLNTLKASGEHQRVFVVLEFASHSMRMGVHGARIPEALKAADGVYVLTQALPNAQLPEESISKTWHLFDSASTLVKTLSDAIHPGDAVVVMSNRSLESVHQGLIERFKNG